MSDVQRLVQSLQTAVQKCAACDGPAEKGTALVITVSTPYNMMDYLTFCDECVFVRAEWVAAQVEALSVRILEAGQAVRKAKQEL